MSIPYQSNNKLTDDQENVVFETLVRHFESVLTRTRLLAAASRRNLLISSSFGIIVSLFNVKVDHIPSMWIGVSNITEPASKLLIFCLIIYFLMSFFNNMLMAKKLAEKSKKFRDKYKLSFYNDIMLVEEELSANRAFYIFLKNYYTRIPVMFSFFSLYFIMYSLHASYTGDAFFFTPADSLMPVTGP